MHPKAAESWWHFATRLLLRTLLFLSPFFLRAPAVLKKPMKLLERILRHLDRLCVNAQLMISSDEEEQQTDVPSYDSDLTNDSYFKKVCWVLQQPLGEDGKDAVYISINNAELGARTWYTCGSKSIGYHAKFSLTWTQRRILACRMSTSPRLQELSLTGAFAGQFLVAGSSNPNLSKLNIHELSPDLFSSLRHFVSLKQETLKELCISFQEMGSNGRGFRFQEPARSQATSQKDCILQLNREHQFVFCTFLSLCWLWR